MLNHCPDSEELLAYYLKEMPAPYFRTHDHLAGCDACVLRLLDLARTDTFLKHDDADATVPERFLRPEYLSPEYLLASKQINTPDVQFKPSPPCLAIRLARSSIQLLKDTLMPDTVTIDWIRGGVPAMAFRSADSIPQKQLWIEQSIDEQQMSLQLTHVDQNQVDLEIRLAQSDQPASGVRIVLKDDTAILYSQKTDAFGKLTISHIRPGQYRLQIPARKIDWIIDQKIFLQPESEPKATQ